MSQDLLAIVGHGLGQICFKRRNRQGDEEMHRRWARETRDPEQAKDDFADAEKHRAEAEALGKLAEHAEGILDGSIRYDLADPERDAREAEALDRFFNGPFLTQSDRAILIALRDRLKGGAR